MPVAKQSAAKFPDMGRCFYPARCFCVKFSELLQLPVLHVQSTVCWFVFFSRIERVAIVTKASPSFRASAEQSKKYIRLIAHRNLKHPVRRRLFPFP